MIRYRCIHCNKFEFDHKGNTKACPLDKKHKTLGHMSYHKDNVYEPNPKKFVEVEDVISL